VLGEGLEVTGVATADVVVGGDVAAGAAVSLLSTQADIELATRTAASTTTIFFMSANLNGVEER
jgi:hypothetical protein